jgi:hypothetical protein
MCWMNQMRQATLRRAGQKLSQLSSVPVRVVTDVDGPSAGRLPCWDARAAADGRALLLAATVNLGGVTRAGAGADVAATTAR